jgi:hypothetical protein
MMRYLNFIDESNHKSSISDYLKLLPLRSDKEEAFYTFEFVLNLVENQKELFDKYSESWLNLVVKVVIEYK